MLRAETTDRSRQTGVSRGQIRRLRPVNHVAAVCYRVRGSRVEFLLVQSRGGRWTFPKGRVENEVRAMAAAREAVEEAGAYGRVDLVPFASYIHAKNPERLSADEHVVDAHLCEVFELVAPEETYRNPTWFSAERSKSRLHYRRIPHYGRELATVVDHALERISHRQRLSSKSTR